MTFRWCSTDEIESYVNPVLKLRNWAELNVCEDQPTCRVLGAFGQDGELVEFFAFQFFPMLGPLCRVDNSIRDSGETSRRLAAVMYDWLVSSGARDWLVVADSPVTERLCERYGMKTLEVPVYVNKPGDGQ